MMKHNISVINHIDEVPTYCLVHDSLAGMNRRLRLGQTVTNYLNLSQRTDVLQYTQEFVNGIYHENVGFYHDKK